MLDSRQIKQIGQLVARGESDFEEWLAYVTTKVLGCERENIQQQYETYFKKFITGGVDVEVYQQVKGEFEKFLIGVWDCCRQGKAEAAANLVYAMLGMFWEWQFCNLLGEENILVYWFGKWEPLGTPRFATGIGIPNWGKATPDIMFIANKRWVFGEVKHVSPQEMPSGEEAFMLRPSEHQRIEALRKPKPTIPYWLIIHNSQRGRWATVNERKDWLVLNFDKLVEAQFDKSSPYGRTTWVQGEAGVYFFPKSIFQSLDKALEELQG
jgi:hypothetical protein